MCYNKMENIIYTVGHSNHEVSYFLELIKHFGITCIIDVRSIAASSHNPQYNKDTFSTTLKKQGITYMHFAEEFGARHQDTALLDEEGKVSFELVRKSYNFRMGVERLWKGLEKGFKIALMCSESEPFDCHRFSMISIALEKDGFSVLHILKDKTLKTNKELEKQLLKKYDKVIPKPDMFQPNITIEQQLEVAYMLRNKDIAYSPYTKELYEEYD
jgi:uncharacterized protein (DUF488 family)